MCMPIAGATLVECPLQPSHSAPFPVGRSLLVQTAPIVLGVGEDNSDNAMIGRNVLKAPPTPLEAATAQPSQKSDVKV